ncbi:MAG: hypothetical protein ACLS63_08095 [Flavonifractor plautii]
MAKLYFRYGVMGSSKTANALMVRYNYEERGQDALLVKPAVDQRDGARFVASRAGLSPVHLLLRPDGMTPRQLKPYAIIVDEAQFLTRDECATSPIGGRLEIRHLLRLRTDLGGAVPRLGGAAGHGGRD